MVKSHQRCILLHYKYCNRPIYGGVLRVTPRDVFMPLQPYLRWKHWGALLDKPTRLVREADALNAAH